MATRWRLVVYEYKVCDVIIGEQLVLAFLLIFSCFHSTLVSKKFHLLVG